MDQVDGDRASLRESLDAHGDLAPPWEQYPQLTRYTIGWRMGAGEQWMVLWKLFLADLAPDHATRADYLRRHAPAPVSWWALVQEVLRPGWNRRVGEDPQADAELRAGLLDQGLIASDVAFPTWCRRQDEERWDPWDVDTPEDAARYAARAFWFWSRRLGELRKNAAWSPPPLPAAWASCAQALQSGAPGSIDPRAGLLTLARMLCAGEVRGPWQLGLRRPEVVAAARDEDLEYVDAFVLWAQYAFDDSRQLRHYLDGSGVPPDWEAWLVPQLKLD